MTSLPYELAKELKDNGLVQPVCAQFKELEGGPVFGEEVGQFATAWAYSPSLSELIAACPREIRRDNVDYHFWLVALPHYRPQPWQAGYGSIENRPLLFANSDSPEEAVARLWLEIQRIKTA